METKEKKRVARAKKEPSVAIDARSRIKPRGLIGMFKGRIILNGTDEEVFNLGLR